MFMLLGPAVAMAGAALAQPGVTVMNAGGVPYAISNPPGSTPNWKGQPGNYSTNFNTNVAGKVEFFDVYGEVHTKYSQGSVGGGIVGCAM